VRIGDPSGKNEERPELAEEVVNENLTKLKQSLQGFWDGYRSSPFYQPHSSTAPTTAGGEDYLLLNNYDWFREQSVLGFLGSVGRHMNIQTMLNRDSVKLRLEKGNGMSLLEFMYQSFQAYDYLHLYNTHNCRIQIGGGDQWGNIIAGCQLIRRVLGKGRYHPTPTPTHTETTKPKQPNTTNTTNTNTTDVNDMDDLTDTTIPLSAAPSALTVPLLTTAEGQKIGKSAGNATVWLDPARTNDYEMYQWFLRAADADVERFLKIFTFLTMEEIAEITRQHSEKVWK